MTEEAEFREILATNSMMTREASTEQNGLHMGKDRITKGLVHIQRLEGRTIHAHPSSKCERYTKMMQTSDQKDVEPHQSSIDNISQSRPWRRGRTKPFARDRGPTRSDAISGSHRDQNGTGKKF